mmetsp:Transcript_23461/g.33589  ORF Transcript_23461/g.33589 Transcript_23461/m.33589 type:complete len:96 (+) Transcript_23461:583-870(+)
MCSGQSVCSARHCSNSTSYCLCGANDFRSCHLCGLLGFRYVKRNSELRDMHLHSLRWSEIEIAAMVATTTINIFDSTVVMVFKLVLVMTVAMVAP